MSPNRGNPQAITAADTSPAPREALADRYISVRRLSEALCRPLMPDDYGLQAMPDVSPVKWHLAHTSWFFETFLLKPFLTGYLPFHPQYEHLFNSYYEQVGTPFPRPQRGLLSRPTTEEIYRYRAQIDEAMATLLSSIDPPRLAQVATRVELGCQHEQQHQELLLTDIKYNFSINPLKPAYRTDLPNPMGDLATPLEWVEQPGDVQEIGHDGTGFAFDNESPRHRLLLATFALGSRLITNGEYLEFIEAGGYQRPEYWLADGWRGAREKSWQAPLYWEMDHGRWQVFTLAGMRALNEQEPVCHVSFYEADAYARWAGKRLPSEAEWEVLASRQTIRGNLRENGYLHPLPASEEKPAQLYGDVWEWTRCPYVPYPGYRPAAGALGEYNGKFMVNQLVLRGGSCVTPADHVRASYRNFFYPADRWQFTGIRLAVDR
ncbi:MAG: ergothioneine biosynthesis protein EgtB [Sulfuricaulis sp.]|nr:ergothioneine biosynthesis protein EgtB [Sulfuricaulis sp.]